MERLSNGKEPMAVNGSLNLNSGLTSFGERDMEFYVLMVEAAWKELLWSIKHRIILLCEQEELGMRLESYRCLHDMKFISNQVGSSLLEDNLIIYPKPR